VATNSLSREQKRLVIILWCTYALFYLGRLNLSPALDSLALSLKVTRAEVGVLGTAFFWAYAVGQFINGELGNLVSPRLMVAAGLGVIALVNILFGLQTALPVMIVLWAMNGLAQASGWGPMLRLLSERLSPEQNKSMSIIFSLSYQFGTSLTWLVAGLLVVLAGWQAAFIAPGVVLLGVLALWWWLAEDSTLPAATHVTFRWADVRHTFVAFWPLMFSGACTGFIFNSILLWIPTYFKDTGLFPDVLVGSLAAIIPLVGVLGALAAGRVLQRLSDPVQTRQRFLLVMVLTAILAALTSGYVQIVCVILITGLLGGTVSLLLSAIPLLLAPGGRTSSVAGTITAVQNIGGGLAGVVVGTLVERGGWTGVFGLWAVCAFVAMGLVWFLRRSVS
jgi:sugar phosphate permease